jgi:hypothetical protein
MKKRKIIFFLIILCTLSINTQFSKNKKNENKSEKNTRKKYCPLRKLRNAAWFLGGITGATLIAYYSYKYATTKKSLLENIDQTNEEKNILNNRSIKRENKNNITTENIDIPIVMNEEITNNNKIINSLEEITDKDKKAFQEGSNKELENNSLDQYNKKTSLLENINTKEEEKNILNNKSINPEEKNNISTENIDIPIEMTEEITKETKITNSLEEINDKNQKAFQEGLNKELEDNISEKKFYQAERNFQGFLF